MIAEESTNQSKLAALKQFVRDQSELLFKIVGIPFVCIGLVSLAFLYVIGGSDLLRYALAQLFTRHGAYRLLIVVLGLALVTLLRHLAWYRDEPPPVWFRRSRWTNVLEGLVLLLVIAAGVWAFVRFGATPIQR